MCGRMYVVGERGGGGGGGIYSFIPYRDRVNLFAVVQTTRPISEELNVYYTVS